MKTLKNQWKIIFLCLLLSPFLIQAQDVPAFVILTTDHTNFDNKDGTREDWLALEKEYHDKVIMQNQYILGASTLVHYYTGDNSEIIHVRTYRDWEDIEAAQKRTEELIEAAWPDEDARNAYFNKIDAYYTGHHSDEITRVLPTRRPVQEASEEPMIYLVQKLQTTNPDGGTSEEMMALHQEYLEAVTYKSPEVKGYYNLRHGWGADNRDFWEVWVYENWEDIQTSNMGIEELVKTNWPDEDKRDAFFEKYDKYFTGQHGDYIYRNVPSLNK